MGADPSPSAVALIAWLAFALAVALGASVYALARLRTRLKAKEAILARAEAEWRYALDFADEALYLIDLDDNLVRGNEAFFRYIGQRPEEAIGRNVVELVHGGREETPCPVCQARRDRRDAVFVKEATDPWNKLHKPIEIIVRILRDADGAPIGVLQAIRDLSRQREADQALRESEIRYRNLSQAAFEGIAIHDKGVILDANQALADMLGYPLDEIIGAHMLELAAPSSRDLVMSRFAATTEQPLEIEVVRRDGTTFVAEVRARAFPYERRELRVVAVRDITELKRAQRALFEEKERLMVTLRSIGEAVIATDVNGRVEYLNPIAERLIGWASENAEGRHLGELFAVLDETGGETLTDLVGQCLARDAIVTSAGAHTLRRADGREYAIEHSAGPIRDRSGRVAGVVLAIRDVTEMRHLARQLSYQASHDALTGLLNRREFEHRLEQALEEAKRGARRHVLCYLDLDQFKVVNDSCGHVAGDQLLRQLAALIKPMIRENDTLARLGGDEFGILLEGCGLERARELAEHVRRAISDFRFVWGDRRFDVGASIGLAEIGKDSASAVEVLSAADAACYVAKDLGRNRVYVHQLDDTALTRHRNEIRWAQRLSNAVQEDRLLLYAQPIVALQDASRPVRYEILVRLVDEGGGLVPPMAFIPAAERYNLMAAVDRWVIGTTLARMRQRDAQGAEPFDCAVNVSGRSLCEPGFLEFVRGEIGSSGIAPSRLSFELTETAAVANFAQAKQFMTELRQLGCRFALDDFGSGLSSFAYLKNLPVDFLKIDGSFVRDMGNDPIDSALVESINQLGHVMGIETIAEYVEHPGVLERLRAMGVDFAQGNVICRPVPLDEALQATLDLPRGVPSVSRGQRGSRKGA
ncbi:diguanylate cyclase [Sulfurifustis variabilis]|uniref:Diguanylate cyclase n=1 Tax=Sulfurifustis variabilis TaxID=1675686 RepID=A0A1B4V656_9GAMM|nr:EAL domain-containing protein [Sulfurifustis variabilis]BAU49033.1 diguanylate cyclase [Sulfurifustis variabilis]